MNFGKGIYDWKGITEKVELQSESLPMSEESKTKPSPAGPVV